MEEGSVRPLRIGVQRKILLLLLENMKYIDDFEVPEVLSQKGMGRKLSLRQNHVSRALTELKDEGLVGVRTAHIMGVGRRRNIYFLKEKGVMEVNDYIRSLQQRKFPVRLPDGGLKLFSIPKILELITKRSGTKPSYYQLLTSFYDGSEFNIVTGKKTPSSQEPPVSRHFFGRDKEISDLNRAINDRKIAVVSVVSLAGMGKTTLMGKVLSDKKNTDWTSLTEWTGPERILSKWARFLGMHGRMSLLDLIGYKGYNDPEEAVDRLLEDLKGLDAILVLDDYHRSDSRIDDLLSMVLSKSMKSDHTILIGSRERPGFYGKDDVQIRKCVSEITLEGLDRESSMKLLEERSVPLPERERIFNITRGHPLSLELICRSSLKDPMGLTREVEDYLGKELLSGLDEKEREVLCLAAVYEEPVVQDGLLILPGSNRSVLDSLKEKLILRSYPDGTLDLHALLRYNLRMWMGEVDLTRYTEIALSHLSTRGSEREVLHYLVLLERSGKKEEINRMFLDLGEELIEWGNSLILDHLKLMDGSSLSGLDRMKFLILKADLDIFNGDINRSRTRLKEALDLSSTLSSEEKNDEEVFEQITRIYNLRAELSRLEGKEKEVISHQIENVSRTRKHGNEHSLGKALNNLALAYKNAGQLNKAMTSLVEASEIFKRIDDSVSQAMVEANLSELMVMKGEIKTARKHLRSVEGISIRSPKIESRLRRKTGRIKVMMRDWNGAIDDLQKAYSCSVDGGERQGAALSMCEMVEVSIKSGDMTSAVSNLQNLIPFMQGAREEEKWTKDIAWCFLRNVHTLKNVKIPSRIVDGVRYSLEMIFDREEHTTAVKGLGEIRGKCPDHSILIRSLNIASQLLRERGDIHASIVVSLWIAEDLLEIGDRTQAKKVLSRIIKDASKIGFSKASKKAEKLLKGI